jgi:tetratricopeptide (TPR) repeat protein
MREETWLMRENWPSRGRFGWEKCWLDFCWTIAEAEPVFRRTVQIREALYAQNPENVHTGGGLALALSNLGGLLRNAGQVAEAEPVLRRAVKTFEALYAQNPENFLTGSRLAVALRDLGGLLSDAGQIAEAEPVLRRLVQIREAL